MKKLLILSFLSTVMLASAIAQRSDWFTIKAFLPNWNNYLIELKSNEQTIHSDRVIEDMYSFTGIAPSIRQATLEIKKGNASIFIPVFIEPGVIRIRDAGQNKIVAFGTKTNDAYLALNSYFDSVALQSGTTILAEILTAKRYLAAEFISKHPSSVISLQLLQEYFYLENDVDATIYYSLFNGLDKILRASITAKKIEEDVEIRYATSVGRTAPFFQLPNPANKLTNLYDTAQFTLIDFWASWCIPCRKENPALVELFHKYKDKGFTIVSVSLDTDKQLWLKAIKKDALVWNHVSELKGWESTVVKKYGIKAIPMNFLLDKTGTIVAKNILVDDLHAMLAKMLK
ncbi:MAG: thioredoxin-like domain-containing protein [Chitinophagaceae bacterium]